MAEYNISSWDIRELKGGLNSLHNAVSHFSESIQMIQSEVQRVNGRVDSVYRQIDLLTMDFHEFVGMQKKANALSKAQQRIIQIRQEIEKQFGHYDDVRRITTGILQANDLGIVRKNTISNVTEELMLLAPGYWLAPCLVALAAWINDQPDVADRALREGINRNDEKTSLLFLLICRRAGRMAALSKWTKRYLENQDEKELDKKAVIIIDAYASGLLGADSEGLIYAHMQEWLKRLYGNVGFIVKQRQFWKESIESKRCPYTSDVYQYLREYSPTWDQLNESMGDTSIHSQVLKNFKDVFDKKDDNYKLKVKLDEILNTLVTDFDEEELPLKMEEVYNKYIIDFEGDVEFADRLIANDKKAVEETKNFAQILTDAAMYPETSHASAATQKFAIALSKEWIMEAYQDTVAQNRMRIPREIEIVVDEFNLTTVDGKNEELILERLNKEIDAMKEKTLSGIPLPSKAGVIGWSIVGTVGMMGLLVNDVSIFIAFIFLITGIAVGIGISYSAEKEYNVACAKTEKQFEIKREKVSETVKACMAEVVDFREEFEKRDSQSKKVVDFLEQISPQQYVRKLADSVRRIKVK